MIWRLPASRAKNHSELRLPPARQTATALERLAADRRTRPVFRPPQPRRLHRLAAAKGKLDALLRFNQPWQFRDVAHSRNRHGVYRHSKDIVNRLLNHGVPQMAAIYDRHHYFDEKAKALQKWSDRLDELLLLTDNLECSSCNYLLQHTVSVCNTG